MRHRAEIDHSIEFRIEGAMPLVFAGGAPVQSGSSLAWAGRRLLVAQDNAWALALADPETGSCEPVPLRSGATIEPLSKSLKPDFEAIVPAKVPLGADSLEYLVFGSGSSPQRRTVVRVKLGESGTQPAECGAFYRALEETWEFSGSELNLEGVVYVRNSPRPCFRLFQRGNGKAVSGRGPVNAIADVEAHDFLNYFSRCAQDSDAAPAPQLENVRQYDLGSTEGTRLSFTDAIRDSNGEIVYLAAAEACPDAIADGPCRGVVIGRIASDGRARHALLLEPDGCPSVRKAEGLALDPGDAARMFVVVDADDQEKASELVTVRMRFNSQLQKGMNHVRI